MHFNSCIRCLRDGIIDGGEESGAVDFFLVMEGSLGVGAELLPLLLSEPCLTEEDVDEPLPQNFFIIIISYTSLLIDHS